MLYRQGQTWLRKVEHVENDGLAAPVLAVMDGVHHLHNDLALMNHLLIAVLVNDSQFALHQYAVVHHRVVVPAQLLPSRDLVLHSHYFRPALQVIRQLHAVPALTGAHQFGGLHRLERLVVLYVIFIFCHNLSLVNHPRHPATDGVILAKVQQIKVATDIELNTP